MSPDEERALHYASVRADLRELYQDGHVDGCRYLLWCRNATVRKLYAEPFACDCGYERWLHDRREAGRA